MRYFALIILFSFWSSALCQDIDSTSHDDDDLLMLIELGTPNLPYIRYRKTWINLNGQWCTSRSDSNILHIHKITTSLLSQCSGVTFYVGGKFTFNHSNAFVSYDPLNRRTYRFEIQDSTLSINYPINGSLTKTVAYIVVEADSTSIKLQEYGSITTPNKNWRIFGTPDVDKVFKTSNNHFISYSADSCFIVCKNKSGRKKWTINLSELGCELLYFEKINGKIKRYDYIFQVSDKRMFGLNSRTGKIKLLKKNDLI